MERPEIVLLSQQAKLARSDAADCLSHAERWRVDKQACLRSVEKALILHSLAQEYEEAIDRLLSAPLE